MRRLSTLTAVFLLAAVLGFAENQTWQDWVRMGYESWTAGHQADALGHWQRAYQDPEAVKHPEMLAALEFNRATALLWFGRVGEAETGFLRALSQQENLHLQSSPGVASTMHSLALLAFRPAGLIKRNRGTTERLTPKEHFTGPRILPSPSA